MLKAFVNGAVHDMDRNDMRRQGMWSGAGWMSERLLASTEKYGWHGGKNGMAAAPASRQATQRWNRTRPSDTASKTLNGCYFTRPAAASQRAASSLPPCASEARRKTALG